MQYLDLRIDTFADKLWILKRNKKNKQINKNIAEAGLYFSPSDDCKDRCLCYICNVAVSGFSATEDPLVLHRNANKDCPLMIAFDSVENSNDISLEARIATFDCGWPLIGEEWASCSAREMAKAGFYFKPNSDSKDSVSCLYCDLELDGWEIGDIPRYLLFNYRNEHYNRRNRKTPCKFFELETPKVVTSATPEINDTSLKRKTDDDSIIQIQKPKSKRKFVIDDTEESIIIAPNLSPDRTEETKAVVIIEEKRGRKKAAENIPVTFDLTVDDTSIKKTDDVEDVMVDSEAMLDDEKVPQLQKASRVMVKRGRKNTPAEPDTVKTQKVGKVVIDGKRSRKKNIEDVSMNEKSTRSRRNIETEDDSKLLITKDEKIINDTVYEDAECLSDDSAEFTIPKRVLNVAVEKPKRKRQIEEPKPVKTRAVRSKKKKEIETIIIDDEPEPQTNITEKITERQLQPKELLEINVNKPSQDIVKKVVFIDNPFDSNENAPTYEFMDGVLSGRESFASPENAVDLLPYSELNLQAVMKQVSESGVGMNGGDYFRYIYDRGLEKIETEYALMNSRLQEFYKVKLEVLKRGS